MNVGLVTDFYYPWIAGPSVVVRNLGEGLIARGHTVTVLAPSAQGPPGPDRDGPFPVERVRSFPVPFGYNLRAAIWPVRHAADWIRHNRLDIVHIHHPFPLSCAALAAARAMDIPVVATNHTIPECSLWGMREVPLVYGAASTGFGWWIRQVLQRCDRVATPTETAARLLRDLGFQREVIAISNGIDTARFAPGPADTALRRKLRLDARPVVLYTGRLDAEKQMDIWLKAAACLMQEVDVQFLIGGRGTERARLERLAEEFGIQDRVRFPGYLSDAEFAGIYRLADVYFITSPVELQSLTALEAVASGLPVVAVQAGALPELVENGANGCLISPGDFKAGAAALSHILQNRTMQTAMGTVSRNRALQHSLTHTIDRYESLLHATIEGRGRARTHEPSPTN